MPSKPQKSMTANADLALAYVDFFPVNPGLPTSSSCRTRKSLIKSRSTLIAGVGGKCQGASSLTGDMLLINRRSSLAQFSINLLRMEGQKEQSISEMRNCSACHESLVLAPRPLTSFCLARRPFLVSLLRICVMKRLQWTSSRMLLIDII